MRTKAPPLLPIFRSRLQGELLAAVLLGDRGTSSVTDLARRLGADVATVQREVERLERAGILTSTRQGRSRLIAPNTDSPLHTPLVELLLVSFGPPYVLADEFAGIEGVDEIYLFGSWVARFQGGEGPAPEDIDVLIVGDADRDELYDAARRAEHRLQREVSVTLRKKDAWLGSNDPFLRQVRSSPLVPVLPTKD